MRRIFGPLRIFVVCFFVLLCSKLTWNADANRLTRCTTRAKLNSDIRTPPTRSSDLNKTRSIYLVIQIKSPPHKSCTGRCTSNREFRKRKDKVEKCFCDPWCDSVFHDCCADYDEHCNASLMKENTPKNDLDELWSCHNIDDNPFPIWMIAQCNPAWKDDEIAKRCTNPDKHLISTQIPVIAENNVTFLNRYCAICNGIAAFKPWDFKVKCNAQPPSDYTEAES